MRIVHLAAGARQMYCGSCLHGNRLAAAIKWMIRAPDLAAECGRRAQQAVHQRYNTEVMARRTIVLYRKVCSTL